MPRPAHLAVAALALVHLGLAVTRTRAAPVTYVFVPLVDVVPGGVPLSQGEATALAAETKNALDQRDIQKAFARMGSTVSLGDLLGGVDALEGAGLPLTAPQVEAVASLLDAAKADHTAVIAVQREILDLEVRLIGEVETVLVALPPDVRGRLHE